MLFHTFGSFYFVVPTFHWQFMFQRFGVNWSLLFYTGRFILGQQPCAELAVQENKKKKKIWLDMRKHFFRWESLILESEAVKLMWVSCDSRHYTAKACTYSCQHCLRKHAGFGEFGVKSLPEELLQCSTVDILKIKLDFFPTKRGFRQASPFPMFIVKLR